MLMKKKNASTLQKLNGFYEAILRHIFKGKKVSIITNFFALKNTFGWDYFEDGVINTDL